MCTVPAAQGLELMRMQASLPAVGLGTIELAAPTPRPSSSTGAAPGDAAGGPGSSGPESVWMERQGRAASGVLMQLSVYHLAACSNQKV